MSYLTAINHTLNCSYMKTNNHLFRKAITRLFPLYLLGASPLLAFMACSKDYESDIKDPEKVVTTTPYLTLSTSDIVVFPERNGNTVSLTFTTNEWKDGYTVSLTPNGAVSAELTADYQKGAGELTLMMKDTEAGDQTLDINILDESGKILKTHKITCRQAFLTAGPYELEFLDSEETKTLTVVSNFEYTIKANEWIKTSTDSYKYTLYVSTEVNIADEQRTGKLSFTDPFGNEWAAVSVSQAGCDEPMKYISERELIRRIGQKLIDGGGTDKLFEQFVSEKTLAEIGEWSEYWRGIDAPKGVEKPKGESMLVLKEGVVVYLTIIDDNYTGTIPEEIGYLTNLNTTITGGENITGTIPESFRNLKVCKILKIIHTDITGEIPDIIRDMTSLTFLDISESKFTGNIPVWFKDWPDDFIFFAIGNKLDGQIPEEVTNATWWEKGRAFYNLFESDISGQRYPHYLWTKDFTNEDPWYYSEFWNCIFVNEEPFREWRRHKGDYLGTDTFIMIMD